MLAFDGGRLSFIDVKHNTWPVILITYPPHALFAAHHSDPSQKDMNIRVLAWSLDDISSVQYSLDGEQWQVLEHVDGPLYSASWNSDPSYTAGLHTIMVRATDTHGRERTIVQPFSMDGSHPNFRLWPRIFLMSNVSAVFQFLFGCAICSVVLVLCVLKYLHHLTAKNGRRNICRKGIFRWRLIRSVVRKIWLFTSVDVVFWPIVIYLLYLPIGPWLVGELLDGVYGVVFAWGTFVYGSFLPGSLSYAYGFIFVLTFFIPLIIGLGLCIDCKVHSLFLVHRQPNFIFLCSKNLSLVFTLSLQAYLSYIMFLAYGWSCVAFSPIRSWAVVFGAALWVQTERLPAYKLRKVAEMWYGDTCSFIGGTNNLGNSINAGDLDAYERPPSSRDEISKGVMHQEGGGSESEGGECSGSRNLGKRAEGSLSDSTQDPKVAASKLS